ncbi:hypothetical protein [Priestia koreensis]
MGRVVEPNLANRNRGTYELVWKTMRELVEIDVRPVEMVGKLVSYSRQE